MRIKGLGCKGAVNTVVPATDAIPYCPKQVSGGKLGLIYYDRIGHCIRAEPGEFYFEANMCQKLYDELLAALDMGALSEAYKLLKENSTNYLEIN